MTRGPHGRWSKWPSMLASKVSHVLSSDSTAPVSSSAVGLATCSASSPGFMASGAGVLVLTAGCCNGAGCRANLQSICRLLQACSSWLVTHT